MQSPATQRPDAEMEMTDGLLISAYMDGNHPGHPEGLLTQQGLQTWEMYHLIGDVMRSDDLARRPDVSFVLGLRERGLRSVAIMPLGYRQSGQDWLEPLKKVRRAVADFVTRVE